MCAIDLRIVGIRPIGKTISRVNPRTGGYTLRSDTVWYIRHLRERIQYSLVLEHGWPRRFHTIKRPFKMGVLFCIEGTTVYDFTNLVKAVEDACNGLVYEDDALRKGTVLPDGIIEHAEENEIHIHVEEITEPLSLYAESLVAQEAGAITQ
jgi:Holliday junction resolvase RusA-like endonuclease